MQERGVVFQSIGKKFIDQAAACAASIKRTNPNLGIAIFADDISYVKSNYSSLFDAVVDIMQERFLANYISDLKARGLLCAINMPVSHRSPFEKTLLIDSDTLVIGDLSGAFDALHDFDVLVCEDAEHSVDISNGVWNPTGIVDTRHRLVHNSGIMYYNLSKPAVVDFLRVWEAIINCDEELPRRNDQDALNYMTARPEIFLSNVRFSGNHLPAERFNAACRFWMEIWESGKWTEVNTLHTYMTQMIAQRYDVNSMNWNDFFNVEESVHIDHVKKYSIGKGFLSSRAKTELYRKIGDRPVGLRQFMESYSVYGDRFDTVKGLSTLYDMNVVHSGSPHSLIVEFIINKQTVSLDSMLFIGMMHAFPNVHLMNEGRHFRPGNDLKFYSEAFKDCMIHGVSRMAYVSAVGRKYKTIHQDYCDINFAGALQQKYSMVVDNDRDEGVSGKIQRLQNLVSLVSSGGFYVITNISFEISSEIMDHEALSGIYKVTRVFELDRVALIIEL